MATKVTAYDAIFSAPEGLSLSTASIGDIYFSDPVVGSEMWFRERAVLLCVRALGRAPCATAGPRALMRRTSHLAMDRGCR